MKIRANDSYAPDSQKENYFNSEWIPKSNQEKEVTYQFENSKKTVKISKEIFSQYYSLNLIEATIKFKKDINYPYLSDDEFRKMCRLVGLARWPHKRLYPRGEFSQFLQTSHNLKESANYNSPVTPKPVQQQAKTDSINDSLSSKSLLPSFQELCKEVGHISVQFEPSVLPSFQDLFRQPNNE